MRASLPSCVLALLLVAAASCSRAGAARQSSWPRRLPLTEVEQAAAGCYRLLGWGADSTTLGFLPPPVIRLDTTVRQVLWMGTYRNDHPLIPPPVNGGTRWWLEGGDTLRLEWQKPSGGAFYGGGAALVVLRGDSLLGRAREYSDFGPIRARAFVALRTDDCPVAP